MSRMLFLLLAFLSCATFSISVTAQKRRPVPKPKPTPVSKPAPAPAVPKSEPRKETSAERIVTEGICKSPSAYFWRDALGINIATTLRSDPTWMTYPDVLYRTNVVVHAFTAGTLKYLYETKAYRTEVFPETYRKHEEGLKNLMSRAKTALEGGGGARLSSSDRGSLYPIIKAYLIDAAIIIQELSRSSAKGALAEAYSEYQRQIDYHVTATPSEGLSAYTDSESAVINAMAAYIVDFAKLLQGAPADSLSVNYRAAIETHKARVDGIAGTNWKVTGPSAEERRALGEILEAAAVDVAKLLRDASAKEKAGPFADAFGRNTASIELIASRAWGKDGSPGFESTIPALCEVLTAFRQPK